jgi:predicted phage terminase large subunit-like protein
MLGANGFSIKDIDVIANAEQIFVPQPGGQTMFFQNEAQVKFYGGAAGSGKTYAFELHPLQYYKVPGFKAIILRQKFDDVMQTGGLWEESYNIYPYFGGIPNVGDNKWIFGQDKNPPSVTFAGAGSEKEKERWKGAQFCGLYLDEITEFSEKQFRYLLTRNRSTCGVEPYVCCSCNPDSASWVRKFIDFYLLPEGTPDKSKRGLIRYFATVGNNFVFGDSIEYLCYKYDLKPDDCLSYTFIYATLEDNPKLLEQDKTYATKLKQAGGVETSRLLMGDWSAEEVGEIFNVNNFRAYFMVPQDIKKRIILIDTAEKTKTRNDWSVAQCWAKCPEKGIYLERQIRVKLEISELELAVASFMSLCANSSRVQVTTYIEDKSAGTQLIQMLRRRMITPIVALQRNVDKYTRARDCQGWVSGGYIWVKPDADYYPEFIQEVNRFKADGKTHDDQVDCMMDAIQVLLMQDKSDDTIQKSSNFEFAARICK